MQKITYLLWDDNKNSNKFYEEVSLFTENIEQKLSDVFNQYISDYKNYIKINNLEVLRSNSEYLLEILMIGVYWNCYINKAVSLKKLPQKILIKLSGLRTNKNIKKIVDFNRGLLETLFLNTESCKDIKLSMNNYIKLLNYLKATGDYKEEVERLEAWKNYFLTKHEKEIVEILKLSINMAKYFEKASNGKLGKYTENVDIFLQKVYEKYKYKEDFLLCSRKRVEYHLNMVGAEIMNKAYRDDFLKSKEKRLLLPACMRARNEKNCKAIKSEEGYICANCTKTCNVNKYYKLGKKYNFLVYIIPHESDISSKKKIIYEDIGIIGVACVLNLISGGLKAKKLGFVPQCVFLDYCGCKSHWHDKGIITDINIDRLLYSLGIE
ncbi:DUF116 domain-containing protein [Terrisporobacter sp.]